MIVEWSETAKLDLQNFIENTHIQTQTNLKKYITGLINYVDTLNISNHLGKFLFYINNIEVRQLLYKNHRIIYYLDFDKITILSVIHLSRDIKQYLEFIKNYLN